MEKVPWLSQEFLFNWEQLKHFLQNADKTSVRTFQAGSSYAREQFF